MVQIRGLKIKINGLEIYENGRDYEGKQKTSLWYVTVVVRTVLQKFPTKIKDSCV